ncbi:MAG: preprotein translocase subunit YajC, partial [Acidobacteria bacterium]|nr:preprotein translocase subunit YajC [Acidobacteriota bacterium]
MELDAAGRYVCGRVAFGSGFTAFIPLVIMFAIFYFLLIRPQQKKS